MYSHKNAYHWGLRKTMISVTRFLLSSDSKTSGGGEYVEIYNTM